MQTINISLQNDILLDFNQVLDEKSSMAKEMEGLHKKIRELTSREHEITYSVEQQVNYCLFVYCVLSVNYLPYLRFLCLYCLYSHSSFAEFYMCLQGVALGLLYMLKTS